MIAYDNRYYYDKAHEPFIDPEWEEAEKSPEEPEYYWVYRRRPSYPSFDPPHPEYLRSYNRYVKCYKPSVAKLVSERTGDVVVPIFDHSGKVRSWWSKDTVEHKRRQI